MNLSIPIYSLLAEQRDLYRQHLLALDPQDRYSRFGYAASDTELHRYVEQIDFERDEVLGIFDANATLIAAAHLATSRVNTCERNGLTQAEFGVSVLPSWRGHGLGSRLFERAALAAQNAGISVLLIQALSENFPMIKIAEKAGARIERHGSETEAYIRLPQARVDTHARELIEQQVATTDYVLKLQNRHFWHWVESLQKADRAWKESWLDSSKKIAHS